MLCGHSAGQGNSRRSAEKANFHAWGRKRGCVGCNGHIACSHKLTSTSSSKAANLCYNWKARLPYCQHEAGTQAKDRFRGPSGSLLQVNLFEVMTAAEHLAVMPNDDNLYSCVVLKSLDGIAKRGHHLRR